MNITILGRPEFNFTLTRQQLDVLMECSDLHYDGSCKAASKVGGFLYGWENQLNWFEDKRNTEKDSPTLSATFRQLDLCLKILEMSPPGVDKQTVIGLRVAFHNALTCANHASNKWIFEYDTEKGYNLT